MNYLDKNITVVGVSHQPHKFGYRIFSDLISAGYKVSGVNPRGIEVLGYKMFKNLKEVTPVPEFVITVVPPSVTEQVVEDCKLIGVKEIWMQPGSESEAAIKKAEAAGIKVTFGACFMVAAGEW
ncbi:MAG: CoA-binding protein [Candidatus Margulisbacteria bacterium]|nr:CoA-binding protein [Candidatus Margulisiibacteriota bacterium]